MYTLLSNMPLTIDSELIVTVRRKKEIQVGIYTSVYVYIWIRMRV